MTGDRKRRKLHVNSNPDAIRKIRKALLDGTLPNVYATDGKAVHVERVSGTAAQAVDDDSPVPIKPSVLTRDLLAHLLAHHIDLQMIATNGLAQEWTPPRDVLGAVLSPAEWPGLDVLTGIVGMPVIRRDGTLLQEPGYDRATGLYLSPKVKLAPIPDVPSATEVAAAREFVLHRLLGDFEWHAKADKANYLGLLVTPFLRRYLRCLTPLGIVTATMPGSGKSILSGLIGLLAGQKTLPWADDDAELRKVITSAFTVEAGVVVWDNLEEGTVVDSPVLASLLTTLVWSDRPMSRTAIGSWPNERLWMVNGNNLRVGGDNASRSVLVRLSPNAPHPEERSDFTIPDLDKWILRPDNQAQTMRHLLVLLLDWLAAGAPRDHGIPSMRQFTPWATGVGGFLAHHDVPDFLTNVDDLRATDAHEEKWAAFLARWRQRFRNRKVRAREVFVSAQSDVVDGVELDRWDGLFITDKRTGRPPKTHVQLGQWLAGHIGRYYGGLRLRSEYDSHTKVTSYWVEEYTPQS